MAKFILMTWFVALPGWAQLFQNPFSDNDKTALNISALEQAIVKFEALDDSKAQEEAYRVLQLEVERGLDLKRAECGEVAKSSDKQRCFREVIKQYHRYLEKSFEFKRTYLKRLHEQQVKWLEESRSKALKDLEKQF